MSEGTAPKDYQAGDFSDQAREEKDDGWRTKEASRYLANVDHIKAAICLLDDAVPYEKIAQRIGTKPYVILGIARLINGGYEVLTVSPKECGYRRWLGQMSTKEMMIRLKGWPYTFTRTAFGKKTTEGSWEQIERLYEDGYITTTEYEEICTFTNALPIYPNAPLPTSPISFTLNTNEKEIEAENSTHPTNTHQKHHNRPLDHRPDDKGDEERTEEAIRRLADIDGEREAVHLLGIGVPLEEIAKRTGLDHRDIQYIAEILNCNKGESIDLIGDSIPDAETGKRTNTNPITVDEIARTLHGEDMPAFPTPEEYGLRRWLGQISTEEMMTRLKAWPYTFPRLMYYDGMTPSNFNQVESLRRNGFISYEEYVEIRAMANKLPRHPDAPLPTAETLNTPSFYRPMPAMLNDEECTEIAALVATLIKQPNTSLPAPDDNPPSQQHELPSSTIY